MFGNPFARLSTPLKFLKGLKHAIWPYSIISTTNVKVMRIKEVITN